METHVPPEVRLVVELLWADLAFVRLVACVFAQVLKVEVFLRETLAAARTLERLVARVEALVVLRQVARFVERFVAVNTPGGREIGFVGQLDKLSVRREENERERLFELSGGSLRKKTTDLNAVGRFKLT